MFIVQQNKRDEQVFGAAITAYTDSMGLFVHFALVVWALPWTALGLLMGLIALVSGGGWQRVGRVVEFHGGLLHRLLRRVPIAGGASAMTLGHVVIARTKADLERSRRHELVHVAQYERWGLLFVPAYVACSVWLWLRGLDAYLDNPFEVEAYGCDDPRGGRQGEE
jgi:hypothetical protein